MRISLDYDKTYTQDPKLWDLFVEAARKAGHEVVCVTMRHPHEAIEMPCEVIYTGRRAKLSHMQDIGRHIDVWIDDSPAWIFQNG